VKADKDDLQSETICMQRVI